MGKLPENRVKLATVLDIFSETKPARSWVFCEPDFMPLSTLTADLATGVAYPFSDWPNTAVPTFGAGVYTIWHNDGRFRRYVWTRYNRRHRSSEYAARHTPAKSRQRTP